MNIVKKFQKLIFDDIGKIVQREIDFVRVKPTISTMFLTYRCDSLCKSCSMWKRPQDVEKEREIGFEEWKIIVDKLANYGIKVTEIFGGNVLLRKELLISLLYYLREKKFIVHMPTNQIGLDDEIAEAISDCVDYLYISVDGIDEHQDMMRGREGSFQRCDATISRLLKLRKSRKRTPRIMCNTTISKYNISLIDGIADYASEAGFDDFMFEYAGEMTQKDIDNSTIDGLKPAVYYIRQEESILLDRQNANLLKEKVKQIKRRYASEDINVESINVDILSTDHLVNGTIPHKKCYVERYEVTIDPSGNIVGCLFFNNYIMGSLLNSSLDSIWNNEKHRCFRSHQNGGRFAICKHCILGVQRNPSFFTSLKRLYYQKLDSKVFRNFFPVS